MNKFKIRCSAITSIMAEPKLKSEYISQGAKTFCEKWLKEQLFGRREDIKSKYISKGLQTEENGLNLMVRVLKLGMIYKNEERKYDEYKTGEIDFLHNDIIHDNKASFTLDSFPMFDKVLDKQYYDQMQGYLSLWGKEKGKVVYTLVDTPIDIIEREVKWLDSDDEKQNKALNHVFTEKYWKEVKETLFPMASKIQFKSIEDKYRVKVFDVERNDDYINKINIKSTICDRYIQELLVNL